MHGSEDQYPFGSRCRLSIALSWLPSGLCFCVLAPAMSSAASSAAAAASVLKADGGAESAAAPAAGTGRAARQGRRSAQHPRLDIDDQISEANRVHDMLKKMSSAAKQIKKSQTKAKQRLIKKASRLNPEDLERIAVLKRVFGETQCDGTSSASSSAASSSALAASPPNPSKGIRRLHSSLRVMMNKVPGAENVIQSLGADLEDDADKGKAVDGQQQVPVASPACEDSQRDQEDGREDTQI